MNKEKILNYYVKHYDNFELIVLEKEKENIGSVKDLLHYLDHATTFNYYTGAYWENLYNYKKELDNITKSFGFEKDYLDYLIFYCSYSDIFILGNEYVVNPILKYIFNEYDQLLTPEQFDNISGEDVYDHIDINYLCELPVYLKPYFNYDEFIDDLREEFPIIKDFIIFDSNKEW